MNALLYPLPKKMSNNKRQTAERTQNKAVSIIFYYFILYFKLLNTGQEKKSQKYLLISLVVRQCLSKKQGIRRVRKLGHLMYQGYLISLETVEVYI